MKAKLVPLSSTDNQQRFYRAVLEFLNEGGFHLFGRRRACAGAIRGRASSEQGFGSVRAACGPIESSRMAQRQRFPY